MKKQFTIITFTFTFTFTITGTGVGTDTITVNAKMSPVHESPPVTAQEILNIPIVEANEYVFPTDQNDRSQDILADPDDDDPVSKVGFFGLVIILMGSAGVLAGITYSAYVLLSPLKTGKKRTNTSPIPPSTRYPGGGT